MSGIELGKKLSPEDQNRILAALAEKGADKDCPRCGNKDSEIFEFLFRRDVLIHDPSSRFRNTYVPTAAKFCTQCGFLSEYSLGILGLLATDDEDTESERGKQGQALEADQ